MNLSSRLNTLVKLGERLLQPDEKLNALLTRSYGNNQWLTQENYQHAIQSICQTMLDREALMEWIKVYDIPDESNPKTVGMVMAGNIPLVGFHDVVCAFMAGHRCKIKISDKDPFVWPYILELLQAIDPQTESYFEISERLANFDLVIATGSNNTARYFELYFGKYPNIIRKNRNGVAVLHGDETSEALHAMGEDVFRYFGLGCRNVSKVYVPRDYDFIPLLDQLHEYREIIKHNKYKNNFDYNFTLLILNKVKYFSTGDILMTENEALTSRIASLHYEYYDSPKDLQQKLNAVKDKIQCVVSNQPIPNWDVFPLGQAQSPSLSNYADGVDTMAFLLAQV